MMVELGTSMQIVADSNPAQIDGVSAVVRSLFCLFFFFFNSFILRRLERGTERILYHDGRRHIGWQVDTCGYRFESRSNRIVMS